MTFIDDAGKACLAAMHRQGAELVAADCLTKDIVAEITQVVPSRGQRPQDATGDATASTYTSHI